MSEKPNERLARIETNVDWIVSTLRDHVNQPVCANCKNDDRVKTNRRLIWATWIGIAIPYLKGLITFKTGGS